MIEGGSAEACRVVTDGAISRESCRHVVWICCVIEVSQVAGHTSCRQSRILAVAVAIQTLETGMRACQRKLCFAVVEGRALKRSGGMAEGTIGGETGLGMIWIVGAVVVGEVAADACGGRIGELVVGVALGTGQGYVHSCKGEAGGAVVECGAGKTDCRVADRAVLRETRRDMVGIFCTIIIRLMARNALDGSARKDVVDVALAAVNVNMGTR